MLYLWWFAKASPTHKLHRTFQRWVLPCKISCSLSNNMIPRKAKEMARTTIFKNNKETTYCCKGFLFVQSPLSFNEWKPFPLKITLCGCRCRLHVWSGKQQASLLSLHPLSLLLAVVWILFLAGGKERIPCFDSRSWCTRSSHLLSLLILCPQNAGKTVGCLTV